MRAAARSVRSRSGASVPETARSRNESTRTSIARSARAPNSPSTTGRRRVPPSRNGPVTAPSRITSDASHGSTHSSRRKARTAPLASILWSSRRRRPCARTVGSPGSSVRTSSTTTSSGSSRPRIDTPRVSRPSSRPGSRSSAACRRSRGPIESAWARTSPVIAEAGRPGAKVETGGRLRSTARIRRSPSANFGRTSRARPDRAMPPKRKCRLSSRAVSGVASAATRKVSSGAPKRKPVRSASTAARGASPRARRTRPSSVPWISSSGRKGTPRPRSSGRFAGENVRSASDPVRLPAPSEESAGASQPASTRASSPGAAACRPETASRPARSPSTSPRSSRRNSVSGTVRASSRRSSPVSAPRRCESPPSSRLPATSR